MFKLTAATISLLLTALSLSGQQPGIDVIHYRIALKVYDTTDHVSGEASIRFVRKATASALLLDLGGETQGKGMAVSAVILNGSAVAATHRNDKLTIPLPIGVTTSDTSEVVVRYAGVPSNGLIIAKNKFGSRTFFSDNWPNRARFWMPCIDEPGDKASTEFIISAPDHYKVISNGLLIEESNLDNNRKLTHWKEETRLPTKVMAIGIADFDVQLAGTVDNIPVTSWVYPENRTKGFYDYALAADILQYFIRTWGAYGYKKLANVQSKTMYGGVENAGAIFYAENSVTGTRRLEPLLAHEIAHQWFGDMATEKKFAHLWLSEGFATYTTALYMFHKYGNDTLVAMMKKNRIKVTEFAKTYRQPVVDTTVTDYMKLLNANSYQKGGWVLHMLRNTIGDTAFYRSLRQYYATYAGKNADTDDLRKIVEEVSGNDLRQFFQQWLFTAGHPNLRVTWMYKQSSKQLSVTVSQLQSLPFNFPLQIKVVNTENKSEMLTLDVSKTSQTFLLPLSFRPDQVILDPETILLFEGTINVAR